MPFKANVDYGPLTQLAQSGGWPRLAWAIVAIVLAPTVEEFLFRGVLLAGFARAWGIRVAASLVTILFVGMHFPYAARYWPAVTVVIPWAETQPATSKITSVAPALL